MSTDQDPPDRCTFCGDDIPAGVRFFLVSVIDDAGERVLVPQCQECHEQEARREKHEGLA